MISLSISVFGFVQFTVAVKFVSLQPYGRKYPQTRAFPQLLTVNESSVQPLAALQNLDAAANRKPYT